jgi:hypothetical protein
MRVSCCASLCLLIGALLAAPLVAQQCCGSLSSSLLSQTENPGRCPATSTQTASVSALGDCFTGFICQDPGRCLPSIGSPSTSTTATNHVWEIQGINRVWEQSLCFFSCVDDLPTTVRKFCPCAACSNPTPPDILNDDGGTSPILIDIEGDGFLLTGPEKGVSFDLDGDGQREATAWTAGGTDDAFLALDRNGNGEIDDGKELFGNHTDQPPSEQPNGFLALAVFDEITHGGNRDGRITTEDSVFPSLVLWVDTDHNGDSTPEELRSLVDLGLFEIELDYRVLARRDRWGNRFRFMARCQMEHEVRLAYDVFFELAGLET